MRKYVVYVTSKVEYRMDGGCHIGEGRWERNVLDALVKGGRETYVVDINKVWGSTEPVPENLKDYSCLNGNINDLIFISHSPPMRLDIPVKASRYLLQWFNGPDNDADTEFKNFCAANPNSVVATYCFDFKTRQYVSKFGPENLSLVRGPAVPQVFPDSDNFNKDILLWSSKNLYDWAVDSNRKNLVRSILSQCASWMLSNNNLKLVCLLGRAGPLFSTKDIHDWFWSTEISESLKPLKDRVTFKYQIDWFDVLDIMKETKLIVSPHYGYGGPPFEAASHGIPMILSLDGHPFMDSNGNNAISEVLAFNFESENSAVCGSLNRLFCDKSFYNSIGNAARTFTEEWFTYSAYLRQIDSISDRRGW